MDCSKLKGMIPDKVFDELEGVIVKFKINTPTRLAHFLAQCAHESANFTRVVENLNYSAARLREVFPKYFNHDLAPRYAHDEMAIGSRIYANRMGNGPEDSFEGWFYRGRGYLQLTGKNNYSLFDQSITDNVLVSPELVASKHPLLSAAWFWDYNWLNQVADSNNIEALTRRINGGLNGLDERAKYFDKYQHLIDL